ncbi:unnamed protein product [Schistocephalus solidus]|uniref:Uncharacterized protein n=1 Tax=Schistocephalus solidus TaxID=70667 RepID=A0A183SNT3_SCHSO|nr:unnamed protein product [Schistocephalus solidus]
MLCLTSSVVGRGSQIAKYAVVKLKQTKIPPVPIPRALPSGLFGTHRPERRTALVARELARYKVDIAALSETRFSEQGQLEVGAGYTFFWGGRPKAERRDARNAFAVRNDIVRRLPCLPQGINDRLLPRRRPQGKRPPGKLNNRLLNLPAHCFDFSNQITEKLQNLHAPENNATVETQWCQLRNVIQSTTLEVLGCERREHHDLFDENDADISSLLTEKNGKHTAYMDLWTDATKAAFLRCHCLVPQRLREIQDDWMVQNVEVIQGYAGRNEMKNLFKSYQGHLRPLYQGDRTAAQL